LRDASSAVPGLIIHNVHMLLLL